MKAIYRNMLYVLKDHDLNNFTYRLIDSAAEPFEFVVEDVDGDDDLIIDPTDDEVAFALEHESNCLLIASGLIHELDDTKIAALKPIAPDASRFRKDYVRFQIWGSKLKAPGEDWCELRLFNDRDHVTIIRVSGY